MESSMMRFINEYVPKPNQVLMESMAYHHVKQLPTTLAMVIRSVEPSFPPGLGFSGLRPCTSSEMFNVMTGANRTSSRRNVDMAESWLTLYRADFPYTEMVNGRSETNVITRHTLLPFTKPGGYLYVSGSTYVINAVMTGKIIERDGPTMFARLMRDKISVRSQKHPVIIEGRIERRNIPMANMYRAAVRTAVREIRAESTLMHYLLAEYGFNGTFRRFYGMTPLVSDTGFDPVEYPISDWVIYESTGVTPIDLAKRKNVEYKRTNLSFAFPRSVTETFPGIKVLMYSMIYLIDYMPEIITKAFLEEKPDEVRHWRTLLAQVIFGNGNAGQMEEKINSHYQSIRNYVDQFVKHQLEVQFDNNFKGRSINDFFDLLVVCMELFDDYVVGSSASANTIDKKRLEVLYYVLYPIVTSINTLVFALSRAAKTGKTRYVDIASLFNRQFRQGAIFDLTSGGAAVMSPVSLTSDNPVAKFCLSTPDVTSGFGMDRGGNGTVSIDSPTLRLAVDDLGTAVPLAASKSGTDPRGRISPYANIDTRTGAISPPPDLLATISMLRDTLSPMSGNPSIADLVVEDEEAAAIGL